MGLTFSRLFERMVRETHFICYGGWSVRGRGGGDEGIIPCPWSFDGRADPKRCSIVNLSMTYYHGRWCDPGETISSIMVLGAPIVGEGNAPPVIVSFSGLAIVKGRRGHLFHGDREVSSTEVKAGALISLHWGA